jgi:hypothetical protein
MIPDAAPLPGRLHSVLTRLVLGGNDLWSSPFLRLRNCLQSVDVRCANTFAEDLVSDVILANITLINDFRSRFGSWVVPTSRWLFCNRAVVPVDFPQWQSGRRVNLIGCPKLVPRFRMSTAIPPFLLRFHGVTGTMLPDLLRLRGRQRGN